MNTQLFSSYPQIDELDSKTKRNSEPTVRFKTFFAVLLMAGTSHLFAATITTSGSGNWSSTTPNAPWPSGVIPSSVDNIIIGNGDVLTVDGNRTCYSLGFDNTTSGTAKGTLEVNAGFLLTITAELSCPAIGLSTKVNGNYKITGAGEIATGTFNCNNNEAPNGGGSTTISVISTINALTIAGDLNMYATYKASSGKYNNPTLNIQSGTVTVKGTITTINSSIFNEATLDLATSASNPTLVLAGPIPFKLDAIGVNTINLNGDGATVNYGATGAQTIPAYPYTNLSLSGDNIKTLPSSTPPISGNFSLAGTVSVTAANALTIGGNVTIGSGTSFNASSFTHTIAGAFMNNGSFIPGTSTINLNGAASQTLTGTSGTTFHNLVLSNPAGVSLATPVRINNFLSFGNVNNSILTTAGLLTLGSQATGTASLKDITNAGVNSGNSINGTVTIERYIQGKRSYRFLSAPVNSATNIKANWMENTNNPSTSVNYNPVANYGTHITGGGGSANGFDQSGTNNPSLFTFNAATQVWTPVTTTSSFLTPGTGYRIMVRGSRSTDLNDNNAAPSITTLRATGTLVTGTVTMAKAGAGGTAGMPQLSAVTGAYNFVANPYASVVNWLLLDKSDISGTVYIYDPTVSGSNGRGAYVAYNAALNTNNVLTSSINNHLQSGQAFFVQTTGPNPSVTFRETNKSTTLRSVFRTTANELSNVSIQLLLPSQVGTAHSADGTRVFFSQDFEASVGDEDSYKFTNLDENIAVLKHATTLSIEGRKPVNGSDTIQLKMWQLSQADYALRVGFEKFPENVKAYLEDRCLNLRTPLRVSGETIIRFTITSDAASKDPTRFRVLFERLATLPVTLTHVIAFIKNSGVQVDWTAESESNINRYEVEKSDDAQTFKTIGSAKAKNSPGVTSSYTFPDMNPASGDNFYRIKCIDGSGEVKFSQIVKVRIAHEEKTIAVLNNAIIGNTISLTFNNAEKGNYHVSLINNNGARVYSGNIFHIGGTALQKLELVSHLSPGIYHLQVINGASNYTTSVLIQ